MVHGTVKWFNAKTGYGFAVSPEVEGDVFIHYTKIKMDGYKTLETGEEINFDLISSSEGKPQADNVVRCGTQAQA